MASTDPLPLPTDLSGLTTAWLEAALRTRHPGVRLLGSRIIDVRGMSLAGTSGAGWPVWEGRSAGVRETALASSGRGAAIPAATTGGGTSCAGWAGAAATGNWMRIDSLNEGTSRASCVSWGGAGAWRRTSASVTAEWGTTWAAGRAWGEGLVLGPGPEVGSGWAGACAISTGWGGAGCASGLASAACTGWVVGWTGLAGATAAAISSTGWGCCASCGRGWRAERGASSTGSKVAWGSTLATGTTGAGLSTGRSGAGGASTGLAASSRTAAGASGGGGSSWRTGRWSWIWICGAWASSSGWGRETASAGRGVWSFGASGWMVNEAG